MKRTLKSAILGLGFVDYPRLIIMVVVGVITVLSLQHNEFFPTNVPAFPGAVGFGTHTKGGRGGQIIFVTNTNDSGAGSFRDAVGQSGARILIFKTGGIVQADSPIYIYNPYITIAGQTAPGNGFAIKGAPIFIRTHDVIIRGMRMRLGDGPGVKGTDRDGITVWGGRNYEAYNVVVDHNSVAWGVDENFSTWGDYIVGAVHDITFSYNISAEALKCAALPDNPQACRSMGMLIGYESNNITVHHNLFAFNNDRNPAVFGVGRGEYVNNVIYGWGAKALNPRGGGGLQLNILGNYCETTPGTRSWMESKNCFQLETPGKYYLSGNNSGVTIASGTVVNTPLFDSMPATSPLVAYENVLESAGARPLDPVDQRIIENIRNDLPPVHGKWIIDSQSEVGGWPSYPSGKPPADSDNDGLPDAWDVPGRSPSDLAPSGYTWIEEYINSLIP